MHPSEVDEEKQTVAHMKKQLDQIQKALSELEARSDPIDPIDPEAVRL